MDDPEYNGFSDISELQPHRLAELRRFFQDYKALENKEVLVQDFSGPAAAKEAVKAAMANYQREFGGRAG
jgi:inorganic pyrophosphatase